MTTMMTTMMTTYLYWLRSSLSSASVSNDISGFMVATRSRCYVRQGACGYTCNTRESGGSTRAGVVEYTRVPRTREYRRKECAREIDQTPLAKSDSSRASEMTALQRRATKVRSPARYLRGTAAIKANATTSREPNERAREREEATSQQQQQKKQQRRRKRNDTETRKVAVERAICAIERGTQRFFRSFLLLDRFFGFVRSVLLLLKRKRRER